MPAQQVNSVGDDTPSATKDKGSQIQRAFALLDIVVAESRPINLATMAERLDLPKPTVHRIAGRLEAEGFLIREPGGRNYGIGPRLNALAADTLKASAQRAPRHAILEWLAKETGETCNLGVLDGNNVVYLDRVESTWPLRMHFTVGSRVPLHAVAMGKLFMSRMPKRVRERLYAAAPLERYTEHTVTDPEILEKELAAIRHDDVATNNQEYMVGLVGLAVPIPESSGSQQLRAALAIHAPIPRMTVEDCRRHLPVMRDAAARLSEALFAENGAPAC
ncbi:MAG: helix-turn-helix domain-containing protein [Alphaproteobacteria bacterium]|nr:helix-turn-helix domain-containing protein [Alphaproteobacteria bacterium]